MSVASLVRALPPDLELVLADVGSAGGLNRRWKGAAALVRALLFDPREDPSAAPLEKGRHVIFPVGLGKVAGTARLNVTALGNMSSVLLPNTERLEAFRKKGEHTAIVSTSEMPVDTLDHIVAREHLRVDVLKVDTQGSELDILDGAQACLRESVFLAEVEVSFLERYRGQPLCHEVTAYMAARGFELLDLHRLKRYRYANRSRVRNVGLGGGQRAGQLAYGDALFMLREDRLLARIRALPATDAQALALKVMLALMIYGKADAAARLFDLCADLIDGATRSRLSRCFRRLGGGGALIGRKGLHLILDYLARQV